MSVLFQACEEEPEFNEGQATDTTTDTTDGSTTTVSGSGKASANLSWDIPSYRENGDTLFLSEIAGYEIVYRPTSVNTYTVITVQDNNTSSHKINNLPAGNYEFMIAVFDTDGLYSDYSDPVIAALTAN